MIENPGVDSGQTPKSYVYQPIARSGTIRVLDLHKTQFGFLECSITQINLEDGGYQALSYEWGVPERPFRILVRGTEHEELGYIALTKNLFDALGDLHDCPDIESNRFWIDQICINQADDEEKGHQVGHMASIYRKASRVITYLGPQSENIERENGALELLKRITKRFESEFIEIASTVPNMAVINPRLAPLMISRDSEKLVLDSLYWIDLLRIIYSGWAHRLWMVQENILCLDTVMLRGRRLLNWISVGSIPVLFLANLLPRGIRNELWPSLGLEINPESIDNAIIHPWRLRMENIHGGRGTFLRTKPDLAFNISAFVEFGCKDPRDRVYAILGISEDAEELGIVPNYESPESQVFIDISMRIYLQYRTLILLSNISTVGNSPDPSIPSWAYRPTTRCEAFIAASWPHPSSQGNVKFEAHNSIMVIKGQIVDKIEIAAPPQPLGHQEENYLDGEERLLKTSRQLIINCAIVLEQLGISVRNLASFFHTWTCNKSWFTGENDVEVAFYFWCLYASLANIVAVRDTTGNELGLSTKVLVVLKSICELLRNEGRDVHDDPYVMMDGRHHQIAFQVWAWTRFQGRSFCISEQKRVCNATGKVQTGDVIALLAGGLHAYLLRPAGDNYQYVGTVWMEELANGAAYKDVSPEEIDYEIRLV
jgi:hypothetical protein